MEMSDEEDEAMFANRYAASKQRALDKRAHAVDAVDEDEDSDDDEEEPLPSSNSTITSREPNTPNHRHYFCSQPSWSQLHFEEHMRKQNLPWWPKTVAATITTPPLQGTVVTNNVVTNTTKEPDALPFTPKLGDQQYNLQKYQEYIRDQMAKGVDVSSVGGIGEAAVCTPKTSSDKKKRKLSTEAAARKQARQEKHQKKAEEKAQKEAELARLVEVRREIDKLVDNFQPDYYACLEVQEEKKHGDTENNDYAVVKWFVVKKGKPEEKRYDICDFNHQQLRKLASKCNVKGAGTLSIWNCRLKIAAFVTAGTMYKENTIANPFTDGKQKRLNTFMRLINVFFLSSMVQRFIDLNDRKKREDYERAHGGDPIKAFFVEASNICNDTGMNPTLSRIAASREGEDKHLYSWRKNGDFNLNDFDPQTYATCLTKAHDVLKARELALEGMRKSGTHEHDFWNFASNPKFLKWRVNSPPLPAQAVYYCHIMCQQYPAIDGKFRDKLADAMKSDSNVPMTGEAGANEGNKQDRKMSRAEKELIKRMDDLAEQHKESASMAFKQRQQFLLLQQDKNDDVKKRGEEESARESWKEYTSLTKEFKAFMRENDAGNMPILRNLAKRILALEALLGIDKADTITNGFA